jgi:hypothetical protein
MWQPETSIQTVQIGAQYERQDEEKNNQCRCSKFNPSKLVCRYAVARNCVQYFDDRQG